MEVDLIDFGRGIMPLNTSINCDDLFNEFRGFRQNLPYSPRVSCHTSHVSITPSSLLRESFVLHELFSPVNGTNLSNGYEFRDISPAKQKFTDTSCCLGVERAQCKSLIYTDPPSLHRHAIVTNGKSEEVS